jgi:hypothetical protein
MPTIVTEIPSDFVNYLTDPGLPVHDMNIPLKQYVCSNPNFGGNAEAEKVIGYATQKIFTDEVKKTKISAKTRSIGRLTTGQGYPDDFVLLMEHIADNIDKLKLATELKTKGYLRDPSLDTKGILNKMVENKVFGLDCIGFISQYLVYAGVWKGYKTYYPSNYRSEFTPVKSLSEVSRLCLVIWDDYHIGIIDNVRSYDAASDEIMVDICQSSSGEAKGPQTNCNVTLRKSPGNFFQGAQKFKFIRFGTPALPVRAPVYICKMPGLVYSNDLASD